MINRRIVPANRFTARLFDQNFRHRISLPQPKVDTSWMLGIIRITCN